MIPIYHAILEDISSHGAYKILCKLQRPEDAEDNSNQKVLSLMLARAPKVIIIGGGLAGPVLALALKKHNIASTVFELRPQNTADAGGIFALAPNALRILDNVGVFDQVHRQGYSYDDITLLTSRNLAVLGRIKNGSVKHYGFQALRVSRYDVREALLGEMARQGIEIRYGAKCSKIVENGTKIDSGGSFQGAVTVEFSDGQVENADIVIGADGLHSCVRKYLDPEGHSEPQFTNLVGVGGEINRSLLRGEDRDLNLPCLILGKDNAFGIMPASYDGNLITWFATIEEKEKSREEWAKLGSNKEYLLKVLRDRHCDGSEAWPEVVSGLCQQAPVENLTLWPFYDLPTLPSYYSTSGRVIVIGDAAHAILPTAGQGAATSLEDAVTLANALAPCLKLNQSAWDFQLLNILSQWQIHRKQRMAKITQFSARAGNLRRPISSKWQQVLRDGIVRVVLGLMSLTQQTNWIYSYKAEDISYS